jgi:hypothetical protein
MLTVRHHNGSGQLPRMVEVSGQAARHTARDS